MTIRAERLRRLRGKGMDVAKLAHAEETLRATGDAQLSPKWVDATVAKVTRMTVASRRLPFVRRLALVAAVLLMSMLTVAAARILWAGRNSKDTLLYPTAVEILRDGSPDEQEINASLATVWARIGYAIRSLRQIQDDRRSDAVREAVGRQLSRIEAALDRAGDPESGHTADDFETIGKHAADATLIIQERQQAIELLGSWSLSGITALWAIPDPGQGVVRARDLTVLSLFKTLGRTPKPR